MKANIGLIGLAVMGENLALNMANKGYTVAVYNRNFPGEEGLVNRFVEKNRNEGNFIGAHTIEELVEALEKPRKIIMMVRAGAPVDELIEQLVPHLEKGDILIDGGNSEYHDTARRVADLEARGLLFIGTGISGGQEGARRGPSVMPGGSEKAWPAVQPILQDIAAKLDDGTPCCQWVGKGAAGHFVKTVHNGIEYGDMQLIAEAYALMKHQLGMSNEQIAATFDEWNKGELNSFLIQITPQILRFKEADGSALVDNILDVAGQKGTGKWSVMAALDEGDPLTLITQAVYARSLSALHEERQEASKRFGEQVKAQGNLLVEDIRQALYASKIISYAQGFSLLKRASQHYDWQLNMGGIAKIWRKGCIIRSVFLQKITEAYEKNPELENLLFDEFFEATVKSSIAAWRTTVSSGIVSGIALPGMSAALTYFDGLRTLHSSANLIQAQRDLFGAHTYERIDQPRGKFFHTEW